MINKNDLGYRTVHENNGRVQTLAWIINTRIKRYTDGSFGRECTWMHINRRPYDPAITRPMP